MKKYIYASKLNDNQETIKHREAFNFFEWSLVMNAGPVEWDDGPSVLEDPVETSSFFILKGTLTPVFSDPQKIQIRYCVPENGYNLQVLYDQDHLLRQIVWNVSSLEDEKGSISDGSTFSWTWDFQEPASFLSTTLCLAKGDQPCDVYVETGCGKIPIFAFGGRFDRSLSLLDTVFPLYASIRPLSMDDIGLMFHTDPNLEVYQVHGLDHPKGINVPKGSLRSFIETGGIVFSDDDGKSFYQSQQVIFFDPMTGILKIKFFKYEI